MENPALHALAAADPEAEFLASGRDTGHEWEIFKENVRPLKRGRNVELLNEALKSQQDNVLKKTLLEKRRRLIDAIDEYKGEDPLQPWLECIKWVQESFPAGGECSGLLLIYEQCVRSFWHDERYRADIRYLKIWMEYAGNCSDAEVIYRFLEANEIGQTHIIFYISYASHMESNHKVNKADEIFNIGIARKAQPLDKLEAAYRKFVRRITCQKKAAQDETMDDQLPARSFGTVLGSGLTRGHNNTNAEVARGRAKLQRVDTNTMISIYKDSNAGSKHQPELVKNDLKSWNFLARQPDRNKENASIPSKWTSYKVPQKPGFRAAPTASTTSIEIFVDDDCAEKPDDGIPECTKPSAALRLRRGNSKTLKRDTELLKENPLRNFPASSLPR